MRCSIFGRIRDASDEVCEAADVVHSVKMVVLCAIQELQCMSDGTDFLEWSGQGDQGSLLEEWRGWR